MAKLKKYKFNGEALTIREIAERVPPMALDTIRRHLKAGRVTSQAILGFDGKAKSRAAAIKNAAIQKRKGR